MTFRGSWNEAECKQLISQLFNQSTCTHGKCSIDGRPMASMPDRFLVRHDTPLSHGLRLMDFVLAFGVTVVLVLW